MSNIISFPQRIDLFEAMITVKSNNAGQNIKLLLVGPDEMDVIQLLKNEKFKKLQNSVRYLGYRKNTEIYYNLSDIVVLPSQREGFPMCILEANACGLPVIGTDIYGIKDAITPGLTGWLVPPNDHNILGNTILNALSNEQQRIQFSYNANEFSKRFDEQAFALLFLKTYSNNERTDEST